MALVDMFRRFSPTSQVAKSVTAKSTAPQAAVTKATGFSAVSSFESGAASAPARGPGSLALDQQDAMLHALYLGEKVQFPNSDGERMELSIIPYGRFPSDWKNAKEYNVKVGDRSFKVNFGNSNVAMDRMEVLKNLVDWVSETPKDLIRQLEVVEFSPNVEDIDVPGVGNAAATTQAVDGKITFWENGGSFNEGVFHHEVGHLIGFQKETGETLSKAPGWLSGYIDFLTDGFHENAPVPAGWDDAAKADGKLSEAGKFVTDYARLDNADSGEYTEDFAEAWGRYMTVLDDPAGPAAYEEMKRTFPNRFKILEQIYAASPRPAPVQTIGTAPSTEPSSPPPPKGMRRGRYYED